MRPNIQNKQNIPMRNYIGEKHLQVLSALFGQGCLLILDDIEEELLAPVKDLENKGIVERIGRITNNPNYFDSDIYVFTIEGYRELISFCEELYDTTSWFGEIMDNTDPDGIFYEVESMLIKAGKSLEIFDHFKNTISFEDI